MTTIDKLLLKIINSPSSSVANVPMRDLKVLKSLAKIVSTPAFITENQSRLLLKILNENSDCFNDLKSEVVDAVSSPTWSKPFRPIDKTKKMYISADEPEIIIEFAFSSAIRKVLQSIWKSLASPSQNSSNKFFKAALTEQNIIVLVETLHPLGFEIDGKIMDFYKTIKSWSENEIKNQFLLNTFDHSNFQKHINSDIGNDYELSSPIVFDRQHRYQYFLENTEKTPENLTEKIAFRKNTKIWINRKDHTLEEILNSLQELKRLPLLLVFEHSDHKKCLEELVNLEKTLKKMEIFQGVGIYFRLPNDESGTTFNKLISENKYNSQLDVNTTIVGVQNGKIPKFFLKNDWKPMSVISIGTFLKHTKTSVYANCCDLIISYTDQEPIIENKVLWE